MQDEFRIELEAKLGPFPLEQSAQWFSRKQPG
jgi:hypothetical protein